MKKLLQFILIASILASCDPATATTQTINTLPSSNSTFITDNSTFLRDEIPARIARATNRILYGGIGSTSASLSHTISAIVANVNGFYTSAASISHSYTASKDTFVFLRADSSVSVSIPGAAVTYDGNFIFAEMTLSSPVPISPSNAIILFKSTTDSTSITSITDYRTGAYLFLSDSLFSDGSSSRLSDAITTIGSLQCFLIIDTVDSITSDTTIPSNINLIHSPGGLLSISSGKTLTISSSLQPTLSQVFDTTPGGTVSFTYPQQLRPEMFGQIDGTADNVQIQAAINSSSAGSEILLATRTYTIASDLTGKNGVSMTGTGEGSILNAIAGVTTVLSYYPGYNGQVWNGIKLKNFRITGVATTGLYVRRVVEYANEITNVSVDSDNITTHFHIIRCWGMKLKGISARKESTPKTGTGIIIDWTNSITLDNCHSHGHDIGLYLTDAYTTDYDGGTDIQQGITIISGSYQQCNTGIIIDGGDDITMLSPYLENNEDNHIYIRGSNSIVNGVTITEPKFGGAPTPTDIGVRVGTYSAGVTIHDGYVVGPNTTVQIDSGANKIETHVNGTVVDNSTSGYSTQIRNDGARYGIYNTSQIRLVSPDSLLRNETTTGGLHTKISSATASITASTSVTISVAIPSGCYIIGCQLIVATATADIITAKWNDGSDIQTIYNQILTTQNTKVNKFFDPTANTPITDATTNIVLTKYGGGTLTAQGSITAVVYYRSWEALANL